MSSRISALDCARAMYDERYRDARVAFLAGSVVRGESTAYSDIDLIVVHEHLDHAYRESFFSHGWPIEAFVHDPETLRYFFGTDRASGIPTLASMIDEGVEIPATSDFSVALKQMARNALALGPVPWNEADRSLSRYLITDLMDDIRAPRSTAEFHASVARLYEMLSSHFCRSRSMWYAKGKGIPRRLYQIDSQIAVLFATSFDTAFATHDPAPLFALCERVLSADGGLLFDGYRADAPAGWRAQRE